MKKNIYVVFLVFSSIIYSQSEDIPKISFGVRAGINLTNLKIQSNFFPNNNGDGTYATTTLFGSFFTNFKINQKLSLQPELGLTFSDDLIFVEVPFFVNYEFSKKITGFIGPKYSYLVNGDYNDALFTTRSAFSIDLGSRYNVTSKFFIDATYSLPLTTQKQTFFTPLSTVQYSRTELRLGAGYRF
jgi:opacity protein-like surface antigen